MMVLIVIVVMNVCDCVVGWNCSPTKTSKEIYDEDE